MSSCAGSSCMCFPKALSAFATLVSLPTGAAPLSCRFAFNYSETYRCPDPTPFSTLSRRSRRLIRQFRSPSPDAPHHLPPWCALLAPKQPFPLLSPLKVLLLPPANYNQTNPTFAFPRRSNGSRSSSSNPNPIQFT